VVHDPEVQVLLDQQAIRDVVLRYCRGIDRLDLELVRACYHPDATDDHGPFRGTRDEYVEWVDRVLQRFTGTMHFVGNQLVDVDGDVARSETYGVAYHHGDPPEDARRNFTTGFRYVDRFERRDGEWRIASRLAVREWTHTVTADQQVIIPSERDGRRGRRDRTDAVYE
jgi:ketosteroid isomerase-like protein